MEPSDGDTVSAVQNTSRLVTRDVKEHWGQQTVNKSSGQILEKF